MWFYPSIGGKCKKETLEEKSTGPQHPALMFLKDTPKKNQEVITRFFFRNSLFSLKRAKITYKTKQLLSNF